MAQKVANSIREFFIDPSKNLIIVDILPILWYRGRLSSD
jgi:hypothetical protein